MVFRSIHGGSLSLCKSRRARIKGPAGRIWPDGRSLLMSVLSYRLVFSLIPRKKKCIQWISTEDIFND